MCPAVCSVYTIYSVNAVNAGSFILLLLSIKVFGFKHKRLPVWLLYIILLATMIFNIYYHTDCGSGCSPSGTFFRFSLFPSQPFYPLNELMNPLLKSLNSTVEQWFNNLQDIISRSLR